MFISVQTNERFLALTKNDRNIYFILDTKLIYTHGIFINSADFSSESVNNYVELTIKGVTKQLSLNGHTHSNYFSKNSDIDIGNYKIVSGNKDLIYYSSGTIIGNGSSATSILSSSALTTTRSNNTYTLLDTGNFSITTPDDNTFTFNYGGTTKSLYYIKKLNVESSFDDLRAYASAGKTTYGGSTYGFINFLDGTTTYALLRINTSTNVLETRTSGSTAWKVLAANITTKAVISNSNSGTSLITTTLTDPFYNLVEGSTLDRSIQLKGGTNISVTYTHSSTSAGVITFSQNGISSSTLSSINLTTSWEVVDDLSTKFGANDGSYLILINYYGRMYTGYFSYVSNIDSPPYIDDEIILHCAGNTDAVNNVERGRLYAKIMSSSNKVYLALASTQSENNAVITIKYNKLL